MGSSQRTSEHREISVFNVHMDELIENCSQPLSYISEYNIGVMNNYGHGQYKTPIPMKAYQSIALDLKPGDLYVINTNMMHVVHPFEAGEPRITVATSFGFSKEELVMWN